jgi:hypothetical protein
MIILLPFAFVKCPAASALAPMYTDVGLTSLDEVISNRKLHWAGHAGRIDWSRLPQSLLLAGKSVQASSTRLGSSHRAAEDGHSPTGTTSRASSS